MRLVPAASAGGSGRWIPTAFSTAGVAIAAAFWAIAWLELPPGGRGFMAAVAVATTGYVATMALLARNAAVPRGLLLICLALALGGRTPLVTLPEAWSSDAVRYVWDTRVQRAGLNPYDVRPEDGDVDWLHTDLTRRVDAAWLPTIYPPIAQLYFRAVAGIHESVRAFRVAALASDAAIALALLAVLCATGRPAAWVLVYAWHPLPPVEGALGAHLDVAGALLLVLSWWALIRHRTMGAAVLFAAAVLVKPLPLVLAPLYRRAHPAHALCSRLHHRRRQRLDRRQQPAYRGRGVADVSQLLRLRHVPWREARARVRCSGCGIQPYTRRYGPNVRTVPLPGDLRLQRGGVHEPHRPRRQTAMPRSLNSQRIPFRGFAPHAGQPRHLRLSHAHGHEHTAADRAPEALRERQQHVRDPRAGARVHELHHTRLQPAQPRREQTADLPPERGIRPDQRTDERAGSAVRMAPHCASAR